MAVGFPTKTTYADGDVFSASDINDTNGTINLLTSSTLSMAAGKNPVINGGFEIWQRGTSTSIPASTYPSFPADRWITSTNANQACTVSREATGDTTNLPNLQYAIRYQRDSGQTGTGALYLIQNCETATTIPYAGKTVTLSFYARKGANYSATSSILVSSIQTGTGTDQNAFLGYTGAVDTAQNNTLTSTWQRFTQTLTLAATTTEMAILFLFNPTGTAGAADYYEITGVQLELGSTPTSFSRAGGTIQGELAACQRYYQRHSFATASVDLTGLGVCISSTEAYVPFTLFTTLRVAPTSVDYANVRISDITTIAVDDAVVVLTSATPDFVTLLATKAAAGFTTNRPCVLRVDPSGNGFIGISAEL